MYSTFDNVRESLKLAWKYKMLWIFALMIGTIAGGGGGLDSDSKNEGDGDKLKEMLEKRQDIQNEEYEISFDAGPNVIGRLDSPYKKTEEVKSTKLSALLDGAVKGVSTNRLQSITYNQDLELKKYLPQIILISISLLIWLAYVISIAFMVGGWSKGALISGTFKGANQEELTMRNLGNTGLEFMKRNIKISILLSLYGLGFLLISVIVGAVAFVLNPVVGVIVSIILFVLLIILAINLEFGGRYAVRVLVASNTSAKEAFYKGISVFRKNMVNSFKLALVNCAVFFAFFITIFGVAAGLLFAIVFGAKTSTEQGVQPIIAIMIMLAFVPTMVIFIILGQAISGFLATYKEFTWSNLFLFIKDGKGLPEEKPQIKEPPVVNLAQNDQIEERTENAS